MALNIKHLKNIDKLDGEDPGILQPSDWNGAHVITVPAASLVGRAAASEGIAEAITIGAGLTLDAGTKVLSSGAAVLATAEFVLATAISPNTPIPNNRALTNSSVLWDKTVDNILKAEVAPGAVTPAMLQAGVQGDILYFGAAGAAARLTAGLVGQALVSGGPAADPAWGYSGAAHALLQGTMPSGTPEGSFASGAWRTRLLDTQIYDLFGLVLVQTQGSPAVGTNRFRLNAGTYVVEWASPAYGVNNHQTRLYNVTDTAVLAHGTSSYANDDNPTQSLSTGVAKFTIAANKDLEIQHQCLTTNALGFGPAAGFGTGQSEVFTQVKIWRTS